MKSVKEIYKIGRGPSSSHTMGPQKAAKIFLQENYDADRFKVKLYGSLAKTGRGHGTDSVITETFAPKKVDIEFVVNPDETIPFVNTLDFFAFRGDELAAKMRVMSVGGGDIVIEGREIPENKDIYPQKNFTEIKKFCIERDLTLSEYVEYYEGAELMKYLSQVWEVMKNSIHEGLSTDGILHGGLGLRRKAKKIYDSCHSSDMVAELNRTVCAYAFAVSEQNAANGTIVTAPTCGSCGVVPAVMKYMYDKYGIDDAKVVKALAAAGVVGNVVKHNASISGAECGCQAEIGTACSMAAAALAELNGFDLNRLEYAAEIAMEHHIGLTCDPVLGLVQIPCIERNAVAALRAIDAVELSDMLGSTNRVSFDTIVKTMMETGHDLSTNYRETAEGGLAKFYSEKENELQSSGVRKSDESEYDALMKFLNEAFGFEKENEKFEAILPKLYKKEYSPTLHNLVICENGEILAAVGLYPFTLDAAGCKLSGISLGNVATSQKSRSRGYMSVIMQAATAQTEDFDMIVLGGERRRYERFGFYRVGYDVEFTVTQKNLLPLSLEETGGHRIRTARVYCNDKQLIDAMYAIFQKNEFHTVRRREKFYDTLLSWSGEPFVLTSDGTVCGYYTLIDSCIHELTLADENDIYRVLEALMEGKSSIKICLPSIESGLIYSISKIAETQTTDCWEMFRINNFAKVCLAYLSLQAKKKKLPDGSVTVKVRHENKNEQFELYIRNGNPGVEKNTAKPVDIELTASEASELFFSEFCPVREELSSVVRTWLPLPITLRRADHA